MDHAKEATLGTQVRMMAIVLLTISLFFFPVVIAGLYDYSLNEYWRSLPATSLDALPGSGTVKVAGEINSSSNVALGAHYVTTDVKDEWAWDCTDFFFITDGNASVKVVCTEYFEIKYPANYSFSYRKAPEYLRLDKVLIIGEVQMDSGQKVIHLKYMSSDGAPIERRTIGLVPAMLVFPPFFAGIAWGRWILVKRDRQHEKQIKGAVPRDISTEIALMGPSLKWISNPPGWSQKMKYAPTIALVAISISITAAILVLVHFHRGDIYWAGLFIGLILIFLVVMPIGLWYDRTTRSSKFAVSKKGIHFWYDDPEFLLLEARYIGWDEIETFGEVSIGDGKAWMIVKKNGVKIWIGTMLDEKSIMQVHGRWNDIRKRERNGSPK